VLQCWEWCGAVLFQGLAVVPREATSPSKKLCLQNLPTYSMKRFLPGGHCPPFTTLLGNGWWFRGKINVCVPSIVQMRNTKKEQKAAHDT